MCFPRIRGDVPLASAPTNQYTSFSPHTRGCSFIIIAITPDDAVFPAYAGMFLTTRLWRRRPVGFPRIRGDVPVRHWGFRECRQVFPAYAGMFLSPFGKTLVSDSFPRIRGDVPMLRLRLCVLSRFSPHTRGCSLCDLGDHRNQHVFPAYAGMFRRSAESPGGLRGFPRIRGDVPPVSPGRAAAAGFPRIRGDVPGAKIFGGFQPRFSPHTRGCSVNLNPQAAGALVFPAYAGMFRKFFPPSSSPWCFPRIRGDVPNHERRTVAVPRFSPHTRGCSYQG